MIVSRVEDQEVWKVLDLSLVIPHKTAIIKTKPKNVSENSLVVVPYTLTHIQKLGHRANF